MGEKTQDIKQKFKHKVDQFFMDTFGRAKDKVTADEMKAQTEQELRDLIESVAPELSNSISVKAVRDAMKKQFSSPGEMVKTIVEDEEKLDGMLQTVLQSLIKDAYLDLFIQSFETQSQELKKQQKELTAIYFEWEDGNQRYAVKTMKKETVFERFEPKLTSKNVFVLDHNSKAIKTPKNLPLTPFESSTMQAMLESMKVNEDRIVYYADTKN